MPKPARSVLLAAAALLVAVATMARADAPRRIEVTPWCARTADRLGFHLAFPERSGRLVVNLTCDLKARECSGATLRVDTLDRGAALGWADLDPITGARVAESGADGTRIRWGLHAFDVHRDLSFVSRDGTRSACR